MWIPIQMKTMAETDDTDENVNEGDGDDEEVDDENTMDAVDVDMNDDPWMQDMVELEMEENEGFHSSDTSSSTGDDDDVDMFGNPPSDDDDDRCARSSSSDNPFPGW